MSESEMTNNLFFLANRKNSTANSIFAEEVSAEAKLVNEIIAGNQTAFDNFYKRFAPMVNSIILSRVPKDDVADLVQEVFITAYQSIKNLREPNAVGGWLAMIARNRANEFYRKMKPTEELSEDYRQRNNPQNEAKEVLDIIRSLPETYKETLIMRLVEGLTGGEIAEQTGLTHESVRVNLHRGMKLLREKLGVAEN
jgi:RNA polymerase sigma-70 factor, ECF subfamily